MSKTVIFSPENLLVELFTSTGGKNANTVLNPQGDVVRDRFRYNNGFCYFIYNNGTGPSDYKWGNTDPAAKNTAGTEQGGATGQSKGYNVDFSKADEITQDTWNHETNIGSAEVTLKSMKLFSAELGLQHEHPTFEQFKAFVNADVATNQWFADHTIEIPVPYSISEINRYTDLPGRPIYAKCEAVYNHTALFYEQYINSNQISVKWLPNLYAIMAQELMPDKEKIFSTTVSINDTGPNTETIKIGNPKWTIYQQNLWKHTTLFNLEVDTGIGGSSGLSDIKIEPVTKPETGEVIDAVATRNLNFNHYFKKWPIVHKLLIETMKGNTQPNGLTIISHLGQKLKPEYENISNSFTNICFTLTDINLLTDYIDTRGSFPMYVDIEFSTGANEFSDLIKKTGLSKLLTTYLTLYPKHLTPWSTGFIGTMDTTSLIKRPFIQKGEYDVATDTFIAYTSTNAPQDGEQNTETLQTIESYGSETTSTTKLANELTLSKGDTRTYWDFDDWLMWLGGPATWDDVTDAMGEGGPITFLDPTKEPGSESGEKIKFFQQIFPIMFKAKKEEKVREHRISYREMMLGEKKAFSETICYRIDKLDLGGQHIQSFYIPNSNDVDVFRYIDTQVRFNETYKYNIVAFQLVYGREYKYGDVSFVNGESKGTPHLANFNVTTRPSVKIFEVPYYSFYNKLIVSKPPLTPEVAMIPYKDKNDRVLITFNDTTGEMSAKPIIINKEDEEAINKIRLNQQGGTIYDDKTGLLFKSAEKIKFKSDDPILGSNSIGGFEIFKTDIKPTEYEDFAETGRLLSPMYNATVDIIQETNKKYYYTFRTRDSHGFFSNPTVIYEVELVDNSPPPDAIQAGATHTAYLSVKILDLEEEKRRKDSQPAKTMKKYIQIFPSLGQTLLDDAIVDSPKRVPPNIRVVPDSIMPGIVAGEKVWDQKFKFIITSKSTGRKLNFNLIFKTRQKEIIKNEDGSTKTTI